MYDRNFLSSKGLLALSMGVLSAASLSAQAATYYVNGGVTASGNGSSWTAAWKTFGSINWSIVQPGDTIYISGGVSGRAYTAPLTVSVDGTVSARVLIARSSESGHNGPVILDGQNSQPIGVALESDDYVTVRGLTLRNFTSSAIRMSYCTGCAADSNIIHAPARGVRVFQTRDAVVRGNRVTTPTYYELQTDGIYSQENQRGRYENNNIVISNSETSGHDDGIQSYLDRDLYIRGNYIEQRNTKTGNAQGIFMTNTSGVFSVVNNIVYAPNTKNSLIALLNLSGGYSGAVRAYNNTLVGSQWGVIQLQNSPSSEIKNNILYTQKSGSSGVNISGTLPPLSNIDYNIYFIPSGTPGALQGSGGLSWSNWRSRGYEAHGLVGDPRFVDAAARNFRVGSSSPAIETGVTLGVVTDDHAGTARPRGAHYEIGCYEY